MADKEEPKTTGENTHGHKPDKAVLIVVGVVVLFFVFVIGIGLGSWRHTRLTANRSISVTSRMGGPGVGVVTRSYLPGALGNGATNSPNSVSGTVTAVNGSTFTVAAYGSTTNVQTNSSTQYRYGDSVKVDDTVAAYGTTSGGTLTATLVSINP